MYSEKIRKVICTSTLVALLVFQFGCKNVERLKGPIEDFKSATTLVAASARSAFSEINKAGIERSLREAQCTSKHKPATCKTTSIDANYIKKGRFISKQGMADRLDALDALDKYVALLSDLVTSDKPEKITASADELRKSVDKLAARIAELDAGDPPAEDSEGTAEGNQGQAKFKASIAVFGTAVSVILSAVGNRKREQALKQGILNGDSAVKDIIEGLKIDFNVYWKQELIAAKDNVAKAREAFNTEARGKNDWRKDNDELQELRNNLIEAINAEDAISATNPSDVLDNMQRAHGQMILWATRPTDQNFRDAVFSIQAYVAAATRLGGVIVKLSRIKDEDKPDKQ